MNLGSLYEQRGNYDSALYLYKQALTLTKKAVGEEHQYYANCLTNLASLYQILRRYDSSLLLYRQALSINSKAMGEDFPDNVILLNHLGLLSKTHGDDAAATPFYIQASRVQLKHLILTYSTLSEGEKMSFLDRQNSTFSYLPSALYEGSKTSELLAQQLYQNELTLKSMVMEDQKKVLNSIRQSGDSLALCLYNQWQFNKAFLGKQLLLSISQRVSYFDSLRETTNSIEQEISRRSSTFSNQHISQNITSAAIAQKLKRGEAAIEFIRFQLYNKKWTDSIVYAAMIVLPADTVPHFISLCEEKQLERLLKPSSSTEPVYAIQKLYPVKTSLHADSLYQLIWKPLENYLQNVSIVYYAPAGLLHRIAFQALKTNTADLLINKYTLNQVLSTRTIAMPSHFNQKPLTAGIWGNIRYEIGEDAVANRSSKATQRGVTTTISSFDFYTSDTRKTRGGGMDFFTGNKKRSRQP
jgi:tetratricopeptide (TPR) repeat protein